MQKLCSCKYKSLSHFKSKTFATEFRYLAAEFSLPQLSYRPLIWMFTSLYLNNTLSSIHERALCLICNDYDFPFNGILDENKQKSMHQKDVESLAVEIYKFEAVSTPSTPPGMSDLFVTRKNKYDIGNFQALESSHKQKVTFRTKTMFYRRPQIWNLMGES